MPRSCILFTLYKTQFHLSAISEWGRPSFQETDCRFWLHGNHMNWQGIFFFWLGFAFNVIKISLPPLQWRNADTCLVEWQKMIRWEKFAKDDSRCAQVAETKALGSSKGENIWESTCTHKKLCKTRYNTRNNPCAFDPAKYSQPQRW